MSKLMTEGEDGETLAASEGGQYPEGNSIGEVSWIEQIRPD